jgi:hypothetical protein
LRPQPFIASDSQVQAIFAVTSHGAAIDESGLLKDMSRREVIFIKRRDDFLQSIYSPLSPGRSIYAAFHVYL